MHQGTLFNYVLMKTIPAYGYMAYLRLLADHLQRGARLWLPRTVLYGSYTVVVYV